MLLHSELELNSSEQLQQQNRRVGFSPSTQVTSPKQLRAQRNTLVPSSAGVGKVNVWEVAVTKHLILAKIQTSLPHQCLWWLTPHPLPSLRVTIPAPQLPRAQLQLNWYFRMCELIINWNALLILNRSNSCTHLCSDSHYSLHLAAANPVGSTDCQKEPLKPALPPESGNTHHKAAPQSLQTKPRENPRGGRGKKGRQNQGSFLKVPPKTQRIWRVLLCIFFPKLFSHQLLWEPKI